MRRSRRRFVDERQMEFGDWAPRRCQSKIHPGNPEVPTDQFVRNGKYLRTCCRACWAMMNRGKRTESPGERRDYELHALLKRVWKAPPSCDHRPRKRP